MFLRSSAGISTALFMLMATTVCSCSEKTFRDINYGTDKGDAFVFEVNDVRTDAGDGAGADGGDGGGGGAGSGGAEAPESPDASPEAAADDAETLDNG